MRYIRFFFVLAFGFGSAACQNNNPTYTFTNEVLPDLLGITSKDTVFLKIKTVDLKAVTDNQTPFFSEAFLKNYLQPSLGTDPEKVKTLLNEVDIKYLSTSKQKLRRWNIKKLNYNIVGVQNSAPFFSNFDTVYELSEPVFTKDKKTAFIYYGYTCGVDCGQGTVKVYKFAGNKWSFFVQFPIWIS